MKTSAYAIAGQTLQKALQDAMLEMGREWFMSPMRHSMFLCDEELQELRMWKTNWAGLMLSGNPLVSLHSPSAEQRARVMEQRHKWVQFMQKRIAFILTESSKSSWAGIACKISKQRGALLETLLVMAPAIGLYVLCVQMLLTEAHRNSVYGILCRALLMLWLQGCARMVLKRRLRH